MRPLRATAKTPDELYKILRHLMLNTKYYLNYEQKLEISKNEYGKLLYPVYVYLYGDNSIEMGSCIFSAVELAYSNVFLLGLEDYTNTTNNLQETFR